MDGETTETTKGVVKLLVLTAEEAAEEVYQMGDVVPQRREGRIAPMPRRKQGLKDRSSIPAASPATEPEVGAELEVPKLAVTVEEAAQLLSLNRTKVFAMVMRGELRSFKVGRSRRIAVSALHDYLRRAQCA